jgi:catechol 2,3-dioxygenase-like lactoylglutathione lyase family enzyme
VRFKGMRHVALIVSDMERSARFYERAFGMRRFGPVKHGDQLVPLVSPGLRDQVSLSSPGVVGESGQKAGTPGEHGGIDHFGFIVAPGTSLDRLREHLESCGAEFLGRADIAPRVPSLFFGDPDGYVFQVTRFPRFTKLYVAALPVMKWVASRRDRRGGLAPMSTGVA